VEPVVVDIRGEYVGLAHLAPDGATMLLYTTVNAYADAPPARDDALGIAPVEGGSTGTDTGGSDSGSTAEYRTSIDVRPTIDRADDAIPTRSPDLGDLALRGVLWRVGVFVRVM
jgi:hypothetical protein